MVRDLRCLVDVNIFEFTGLAPAAHGLNQTLGRACHRREVNVVAGFDDLNGLVGCGKSDFVAHFVVYFV